VTSSFATCFCGSGSLYVLAMFPGSIICESRHSYTFIVSPAANLCISSLNLSGISTYSQCPASKYTCSTKLQVTTTINFSWQLQTVCNLQLAALM